MEGRGNCTELSAVRWPVLLEGQRVSLGNALLFSVLEVHGAQVLCPVLEGAAKEKGRKSEVM